jgi:hypothetical protein
MFRKSNNEMKKVKKVFLFPFSLFFPPSPQPPTCPYNCYSKLPGLSFYAPIKSNSTEGIEFVRNFGKNEK